MKFSRRFFLPLFACVNTNVAAASDPGPSPLVNAACQRIASLQPDKLYWPGTTEYLNETDNFWSRSVVLEPYCVYSPSSAHDVGQALSILRSTQTQFAVRGGGHMPVKGAASTNQGVLIVMTRMRTLNLSSDKQIASVGPGLRWQDVYEWIGQYGRVVVGGRYPTVGVSGYLLGGGISFLSGQYGWGANNVKNYEIVTADSQILNVNASFHPDLFWALKGGSSNFGIVTRFDLQTFPQGKIYGGTVSYNTSSVPSFLDALENWISPGGGIVDASSAINPNIFLYPNTGVVQGNVAIFRNSNDSAPNTLRNFTQLSTLSDTAHVRTYIDFLGEGLAYGNQSLRWSYHATSMVANTDAVRTINETVLGPALTELKNVENCFVSIGMQPITASWLQAARAAGGDAIDLDPADGNFLAFILVLQWINPADDTFVTSFANSVVSALDKTAQAKNLYYPYIYLNDAGAGENPFILYGKGKSLEKMKKTRQQYDPAGVFQYLQPGGFKLGS